MAPESVHERLCRLIGEDPYEAPDPALPTLRQAARTCEPGQVVAARTGDRPMAVLRLPDGSAFAVPDHCPHAGARLSQGYVEAGYLVCPEHGWRFDLATGRCLDRPRVSVDVVPLAATRRRRRPRPAPLLAGLEPQDGDPEQSVPGTGQ